MDVSGEVSGAKAKVLELFDTLGIGSDVQKLVILDLATDIISELSTCKQKPDPEIDESIGSLASAIHVQGEMRRSRKSSGKAPPF